jgi:hypothetical protein
MLLAKFSVVLNVRIHCFLFTNSLLILLSNCFVLGVSTRR